MKQIKFKHLVQLIDITPLIIMKWIDSPFIRNYEAVDYIEITNAKQKEKVLEKYGEQKIKKISFGSNIKVNGINKLVSGIMIYFEN